MIARKLEVQPVVQPRWYVGHVNTLDQVPVYWTRPSSIVMRFMLPADGLGLAFRHVNALDVGTPGFSIELAGVLKGIEGYAAQCPRPDGNPDGGQAAAYPEGLPGLRIVENTPMRADLKALIATVPACFSCHESQDVGLEVDHAGGWFFGCSACGRAFRYENPDVCGACDGDGQIHWAKMVAGAEMEFAQPCEWCQGAGR